MTEVDERIARVEELLESGEPDADVLAHTLNMLRQLRAEESLDAATD